MAFGRKPKIAEPAPYNAPRTMVSSAARVHLTSKPEVEAIRQRASTSAGWQLAAWQCYKHIGEVNYSFNYAASILSRIRFHAAVNIEADSAPVDVTDAAAIRTDDKGSTVGTVNGIDPRLALRAKEYMRQLSSHSRMAPMAKAYALNLQVAGECYLVCINEKWSVRSTSELKIDAGGHAILQPSMSVGTMTPRRLKKGTPIGRIWNQDPQYSVDADSSLHAVLDDCEELILLSRLMRVTARSRLNAGILFVPDELSASARTIGGTDENDSETDEDEDPLEKELFDTMTAPVAQEDNAAAIVPMLIRGPSAEGANIKYIQLARDVGTSLETRSEKVLSRVLQGINAPRELNSASGQRTSNASAIQMIDDQTYKALVEPLALVWADAITEIYLQPLLRADVEIKEWANEISDLDEQIQRIVCWYDPSEVTTSVDQSAAASQGWDRHILSDSAWLKANGFSDNDKASEQELAVRLALAQVAIPPNIQSALFQTALPRIFAQAQQTNQTANGVGMPDDLSQLLGNSQASTSVAPSPPIPATSVPAGVS